MFYHWVLLLSIFAIITAGWVFYLFAKADKEEQPIRKKVQRLSALECTIKQLTRELKE